MTRHDPLEAQRTARRRARAELERRLTAARVDLAPAVLRRRAAAEAQRTARSAARQALGVAAESPGIVAATIAALVLWLARRPVGAGTGRVLHRLRARKGPARSVRGRVNQLIDGYWRRLKDYADD